MKIRDWLRKNFRKTGFDLVRYEKISHPEARRMSLISEYGIDVVLDVGANTGQYASHLRYLGFAGRMISFEPLAAAFAELERRSASDPLWSAVNYALGDEDSKRDMNVAENSASSSMLDVLPEHLDSEPRAQSVDKQTIELRRLDSIYDELCSVGDSVYLKLDAQGYEMHILNGGIRSLERIDTIQMEMSLTPLYQDETLLPEMTDWLYKKGYVLVGIETGHSNRKTGQLMQVDGIFHRFEQ